MGNNNRNLNIHEQCRLSSIVRCCVVAVDTSHPPNIVWNISRSFRQSMARHCQSADWKNNNNEQTADYRLQITDIRWRTAITISNCVKCQPYKLGFCIFNLLNMQLQLGLFKNAHYGDFSDYVMGWMKNKTSQLTVDICNGLTMK